MRLRPSTQRLFYRSLFHSSIHNALVHSSRPQLCFLPTRSRQNRARLISTETKEWLKHEVKIGLKYSAVITATGFFLLVMATGIQEEHRAHIYPTPDEWGWNTRLETRAAKAREDSSDPWMKNWMMIGGSYERVMEKLQDPNREGQLIVEQAHGACPIPVKNEGRPGFDISHNSEPWRRGYYEVLMGLARTAEQLDNHVRDRAMNKFLAWPANSIIGPSNPRPRPIPVGMPPPPVEEDCVPAFKAPDLYYGQILTTKGFTEKQRVDAAISYGLWLEYKGKPDLAQKMYKWALDLANSNSESGVHVVDPSTGVINSNFGSPSENILSATTALATYYAVNSKVYLALPLYISILRARKSLPEPPSTLLSTLSTEERSNSVWGEAILFMKKCFKPPKYPPPPSDGCAPPYRDAKERCQEAGIMLYIGEILYASKRSSSNREDGLAWTREAVDFAEAELRQKGVSEDAKKTCKQCLSVGLQNWVIMVEKLAREERENKTKNKQSWLNFASQESAMGRWESEEQVIKDRLYRAHDLLSVS